MPSLDYLISFFFEKQSKGPRYLVEISQEPAGRHKEQDSGEAY
ncbi:MULTISPECIES: hypothetical protein [Methanosarcina]|nr:MULTISPECIES: hypothetical protein [Methanosarcina]HOW14324.1 hypothetical protein [Methanosarcina sp.]